MEVVLNGGWIVIVSYVYIEVKWSLGSGERK